MPVGNLLKLQNVLCEMSGCTLAVKIPVQKVADLQPLSAQGL